MSASGLPSRWVHTVGPRIAFFEAQFPARRCLCLRFTRYLAAPSARLEVKMVRYSFLVGLFHPRLHAGLSRRLRLLTRVAPRYMQGRWILIALYRPVGAGHGVCRR